MVKFLTENAYPAPVRMKLGNANGSQSIRNSWNKGKYKMPMIDLVTQNTAPVNTHVDTNAKCNLKLPEYLKIHDFWRL